MGSAGSPESLKMHRFPYIFHVFFGGVGSRNPKIIENSKFPYIFYDFFGGMESVGNPEPLKMH